MYREAVYLARRGFFFRDLFLEHGKYYRYFVGSREMVSHYQGLELGSVIYIGTYLQQYVDINMDLSVTFWINQPEIKKSFNILFHVDLW